jgi:hypothetical protein
MQVFGPTWEQGRTRPRFGPGPLPPAIEFGFLGSLPGPFTFARASNASYFDSIGTLQTAATDVARVGYDPTGASLPGTLLEATSTNQIRNPRCEGAVPGTPGTAPTNMAVLATAGLAFSIVAAGAESGIPQLDVRVFGTTTGAATVNIRFETTTGIAALTGQTWTASAFFRLIAGGFGAPTSGPFLQINEGTAAGAFVAGGGVAITPTGAALNTQRVTYTRTLSGGATVAIMYPLFVVNYPTASVVDFTIRIGLPQAEQQAYASSPIMPPVGVPNVSTRAADNLSLLLPYAGFPGPVGWTAALEFVPLALPGNVVALGIGGASGDYATGVIGGDNKLYATKSVGGVSVASSGTAATVAIGALAKAILAQDTVDLRASLNGSAVISAVNAGYPAMSALRLMQSQPGRLRRLRLWPRKLSDAEVQAAAT